MELEAKKLVHRIYIKRKFLLHGTRQFYPQGVPTHLRTVLRCVVCRYSWRRRSALHVNVVLLCSRTSHSTNKPRLFAQEERRHNVLCVIISYILLTSAAAAAAEQQKHILLMTSFHLFNIVNQELRRLHQRRNVAFRFSP